MRCLPLSALPTPPGRIARDFTMRVNVRLLFGLLACVALCGAGTHLLHGHQLRRNAGTLLARADRAEQESQTGDPGGREAGARKAAEYLRRYLAHQPGDTEARARLAGLLGE